MAISTVTRAAIARIWEQPQHPVAALFTPIGWWTGNLDEVRFLERLYRLDDLGSTDDRYPNARGDIIQHCLNNDDWHGVWVLTDARFELDDDVRLLAFLAETIHPAVRTDPAACIHIANEYNKLLRRDGVELHVASHVSGLPIYAGRRYVPSASDLRDALANAISAEVKAYNVADFCTKIGLGPTSEDFGDPMNSKATYVGRHAMHADTPQLIKAARATLVEFDHAELRSIVEAASSVGQGGGVDSPPKNLIFASIGPKPELVLRDAISNDIEITKYADSCLVYVRPLTDDGLSWHDLIDWWSETRTDTTELDVGRDLYYRLKASLSDESPGEHLILRAYGRLLREIGFGLPALIPQVYLHLDPRTRVSADKVLARQRMDFLLLLPERHRVILEFDGQQHYSTPDGKASPALYGEMMAEDRRIRLEGYEVYRFGGAEFQDTKAAEEMLRHFFLDLLAKHGIGTRTASVTESPQNVSPSAATPD